MKYFDYVAFKDDDTGIPNSRAEGGWQGGRKASVSLGREYSTVARSSISLPPHSASLKSPLLQVHSVLETSYWRIWRTPLSYDVS